MSDPHVPDPRICRRLEILGRVQGVAYRASAAGEAKRLGLIGWVRNRRDGSVEALVAGPTRQVEAFIAWARRGPPAAAVSSVAVQPGHPPEGRSFKVRPSV